VIAVQNHLENLHWAFRGRVLLLKKGWLSKYAVLTFEVLILGLVYLSNYGVGSQKSRFLLPPPKWCAQNLDHCRLNYFTHQRNLNDRAA